MSSPPDRGPSKPPIILPLQPGQVATPSPPPEKAPPFPATPPDEKPDVTPDATRLDKTNELLLTEWKEVRESLRYFGNKRFAQLTVFIAANGFLINACFARDNPLPGLWCGLFGVLLALIFRNLEKGSVEFFTEFAKRGLMIEDQLKVIRLIHCRPARDLATSATYWMYWLALFGWFGIMVLDLSGIQIPKFHVQWSDIQESWKALWQRRLP